MNNRTSTVELSKDATLPTKASLRQTSKARKVTQSAEGVVILAEALVLELPVS